MKDYALRVQVGLVLVMELQIEYFCPPNIPMLYPNAMAVRGGDFGR